MTRCRMVVAVVFAFAFVAALVLVPVRRAAAQTSTPPSFAQQVNAATTGAQVTDALVQRAGSQQLLDARMAEQFRANALGYNALRAEAPQAAKLFGKRMIVAGMLPRAAALLGPVGWTAAAVATGYELCNAVLGCFKSKATELPPAPFGSLESFGDGQIIRLSAVDSSGAKFVDARTGAVVSSGTIPTVPTAALGPWSAAIGVDGVFYGDTAQPYTRPFRVEGAPSGVRVVESQDYGSSPSSPRVVTILFKPLEDSLDIEHEQSCTTGSCGALPSPDDAVWPRQLRDALADQLDLMRRLASQLYPGEVRDPYSTTTTIPKVEPRETYASYIARLQGSGLLGKLVFRPDPSAYFGPDQVMDVIPRPGHVVRLDTEVRVYANPSYAPDPNPDSGNWADPWEKTDPDTGLPDTTSPTPSPPPGSDADQCSLRPPKAAVDTSPFTSLPADRFPLTVLPWAKHLLDGFTTGGPIPEWRLSVFGQPVDLLAWLPYYEEWFGWARTVLVFMLWAGVAFGLYSRTFGRA